MALVPNFSLSQPAGDASILRLADTSTGSDGTITTRRVYVQTANGSYLVKTGTTTTYELWPYADSTIDLSLLTKDYALSVRVDWLDAGGAVVYTKSVAGAAFTLYNDSFLYGLTQLLAGNPLLINDNRFFELKSNMRELVDSGQQAVVLPVDLYAAQQCFDRATEMRLNANYLFNGNS